MVTVVFVKRSGRDAFYHHSKECKSLSLTGVLVNEVKIADAKQCKYQSCPQCGGEGGGSGSSSPNNNTTPPTPNRSTPTLNTSAATAAAASSPFSPKTVLSLSPTGRSPSRRGSLRPPPPIQTTTPVTAASLAPPQQTQPDTPIFIYEKTKSHHNSTLSEPPSVTLATLLNSEEDFSHDCKTNVTSTGSGSATISIPITTAPTATAASSSNEVTRLMNLSPINVVRLHLDFIHSQVKTRKQTLPLFYIADTEGQQYLSQICLMPLTDGTGLCETIFRNILIPTQYGSTPVKSQEAGTPVTFRSVVEALNKQTEHTDEVYILFHNGRAHDEPVLKRAAKQEGFDIPTKYKFGDTMNLFQLWLSGVKAFDMQTLYEKLFNSQPRLMQNSKYEWHMANFDTFHLRQMIRYLIILMWKRANQGIVSVAAAAAEPELESRFSINPDAPLSESAVWGFWYWLEHERQKPRTNISLRSGYSVPVFSWKTMDQISEKEEAQLKPNVHKEAVYTSLTAKMRHIQSCKFVSDYHLKPITDATILADRGYCQKCCFQTPVVWKKESLSTGKAAVNKKPHGGGRSAVSGAAMVVKK